MQHRKDVRKQDTVNFRVEAAFRERIDRAIERQQQAAPLGARVTIADFCRGLIELGLTTLEQRK
jgi:hypothetical protein